MNNYIATQVDRSFLYLMAIYAIHGILLHVFLMNPQLHGTKMNWNIVTIHISNGSIAGHNSNLSGSAEPYSNIVAADVIEKWNNSVNDYDYVSHELIQSDKSFQREYVGAATCYSLLSKSETLHMRVMSCGSTIQKNMGPAVLGIILGCMAFLLTYTDNINTIYQQTIYNNQ